MTDGERQILLFIWEDCRALIAALKLQRWDVCKWAVTANLTVAAATIAMHNEYWAFALMAIFVAATGVILIFAYNRRITGVRSRLTKVVQYARQNIFDFNQALEIDIGKAKDTDHDRDELQVFWAAIVASAIPCLVVWGFHQ